MAGVSPIDNPHPLYGWNAKSFLNLNAANGDQLYYESGVTTEETMISGRIKRLPGLRQVTLFGSIATDDYTSDGNGTARINLILEGSNSGIESDNPALLRNVNSNWETIAQLDPKLYWRDVTGPPGLTERRILGTRYDGGIIPPSGDLIPRGDMYIDVERYEWLRIRIEIVVDDNITVAMDNVLAGIALGDEEFDRELRVVLPVGESPLLPHYSGIFKRPAGSRYMAAYGYATELELDGGGYYRMILEGTWDGLETTGPWVDIASTGRFIAQDQAEVFSANGSNFLDMGGFQWFRVRGAAKFPPPGFGPAARYTIDNYIRFDGNDVVWGETNVADLHDQIQKTFCMVSIFQVEDQVGTERELSIQILDMNNIPIEEQRVVYISLTQDSDLDGLLAPAVNFDISSISKGSLSAQSTVGNVYAVETDVDGIATFKVRHTVPGADFVIVHPLDKVMVRSTGQGVYDVGQGIGQTLIAIDTQALSFV